REGAGDHHRAAREEGGQACPQDAPQGDRNGQAGQAQAGSLQAHRLRRRSRREQGQGGPPEAPRQAVSADGRCPWALSTPDYLAYHDDEWGRPVTDDRGLYERMTLEAFQSGLSWITILRKRDAFREVFAGFDVEAVAAFGETDVERL